ncbi:porin [Burkholderia gladioli]|uniref:porin n=1 Tax=Burkholderia gladioli TaxID=28095 RepID=UPI0016401843|nr:porin [Burkholderia gladioli]
MKSRQGKKWSSAGRPAGMLAVAMACVVPAGARAQSSVTLYGVIDTFVTNIHASGKPSVTRMDSSGLWASRWGVRGTEELGGGYKTTFALENGFNSNDGSQADANRFLNRQAWVGIASDRYGEIRLGRQNSPQWVMNGRIDAFYAATQASGWNNFYGGSVRVDNAIGYLSPVVDGFKFYGLYARGAVSGGSILPQDQGNQNYHVSLEYERGPLYIGTNYENIRNETLKFTMKRATLGGSYKFGDHWQVYLAADDEKASDDSTHTNLLAASFAYSFSVASRFALGYAYLRDHVSGSGHGNASQIGAMYSYALSKATTIYATYAYLDQQGTRSNLVLSGAAVVESAARIVSTPGGSINGVAIGLVHFF